MEMPPNALRLRLTNHAFLFLLKHFSALSKLSIHDWSNLDNKFLCDESIRQLKQHCFLLNRSIELELSSYTWHWQLSKLDLF